MPDALPILDISAVSKTFQAGAGQVEFMATPNVGSRSGGRGPATDLDLGTELAPAGHGWTSLVCRASVAWSVAAAAGDRRSCGVAMRHGEPHHQWSIDCRDGQRLAEFWTSVLDWVVTDRDEAGSVTIKPLARRRVPGIDFLVVPDGPKRTKNRLHLDLNPTDRDQDAELQRLLSLGAREVDIGQGDVSWHVLADPEGNEFCLLRRRVQPEGA